MRFGWFIGLAALVACGEPDLENGQLVYDTQCMACHSDNTIIEDTSPELSDSELKSVIVNGVGDMPPMSNLTNADVRDVIAFIRTLEVEND